jgi:hypothetical protein
MVMVAKVEGEKNMVVIEKIGECIYSMCILQKDLKIKDIRTAAKTAKELDQKAQVSDGDRMQVDGDEWWRRMVVQESQRRDEQDLNLNFLIDDGTAEYFLSRMMLMIGQARTRTPVWTLQSRCHSNVMTPSSPLIRATFHLPRTPSHKQRHL